MNTGEKNDKGRIIYKGPRGGVYVLTPGGSRVTKFTKAPTTSVPKNDKGRIIYKGPKGGLYVLNGKKKVYTFKASANNRERAKGVVPPSPKKTTNANERNKRLAVLRARLEAHAAKIRAAKPKSRKNIENRLRLALYRVRARRAAAPISGSKKQLSISFCHEPAAVPRQKCTLRKTIVSVYRGKNPLIDSGEVVAMHENDFDMDWFTRQSEYISKLNDYDLWTLQAHTNRSHAWIGPYTYKGTLPTLTHLGGPPHITPLWPQIRKLILDRTNLMLPWMMSFRTETNEKKRYDMLTAYLATLPASLIKKALDMYIEDLKKIIAGAPKAKKKMILYRGTGIDIFQGTYGHRYKLRSFCSAAYNVKWATAYGSTIQRITVLPGTPVLLAACTNQWTYDGEFEVMVNIDTHYLIRARNVLRNIYYNGKRFVYGAQVTDVIITK